MKQFNKRDGFAYFGAVQKNGRWSWAAKTPQNDRVVISIWHDQMMGGWGSNSYLDTRELSGVDGDPSTWSQLGNRDRIELLKHARDALGGVLYVLIFQAKEPLFKRKFESATPWQSSDGRVHRMKLVYLAEDTGHFRVEYLDSAPLDL